MSSRVNSNPAPPLPAQPKRIYCAYHPAEALTNFCGDKGCLMPLCPNCIVQHTQQHFFQKNKPCYTNLNEALYQTRQKCYQHIVMFEQLNRSNDRIYDYVLGLRQSIHNQLQEDKQEVFKEIDQLFQQHQETIFRIAVDKYKNIGVYDQKQSNCISQFITEQIETLHQQIAVLKGDNCLAGLITYFASDRAIYEESIRNLGQYVDKHTKAGRLSINMSAERLLKSLDGFCQSNIEIEFINDSQNQEESRLKENRSQAVKHVPGRLGLKPGGQLSKENRNTANQDFKSLVKKSKEFYKIEPMRTDLC